MRNWLHSTGSSTVTRGQPMTDTEQVERWVRTDRLLKDEADYLRQMLHKCEAELCAHRSQRAPAKEGDRVYVRVKRGCEWEWRLGTVVHARYSYADRDGVLHFDIHILPDTVAGKAGRGRPRRCTNGTQWHHQHRHADAVVEWARHCTRGRPLTEVLGITPDAPLPHVGAQPTSGDAGGAGGVP